MHPRMLNLNEASRLLEDAKEVVFTQGSRSDAAKLRAHGIPSVTAPGPLWGQPGLVFPQQAMGRVAEILCGRWVPDETPFRTEKMTCRSLDRRAWRRRSAQWQLERRPERLQERFVKLCQRRTEQQLPNLDRRLAELLDRQDQLLNELGAVTRQIDLIQRRRRSIVNGDPTESREWWLEELERIFRLPTVRTVDVDLDSATLIVVTDPLFSEEQIGRELVYCDLGVFEIFLPPQTSGVRMHNLTRTRAFRDAPSIINGRACLGAFGAGLAVHLARGEYAAAVQGIIAFITREASGGYADGGWEVVDPKRARPQFVHETREEVR